jgi:hypothetical protein
MPNGLPSWFHQVVMLAFGVYLAIRQATPRAPEMSSLLFFSPRPDVAD